MKKLLVICLICMMSIMTACGKNTSHDNTSEYKEESSNKVDNKSANENKEYDPVLKIAENEYAVMQKSVENIQLIDYIPDNATYCESITDGSELTDEYTYFIQNDKCVYSGQSIMDKLLESNTWTNGYLYYDKNSDAIINKQSSVGGEFERLLIGQIGRKYEVQEGVSVETLPYLFEVTTQAGTFNDCICVLNIDVTTEREGKKCLYYAKGIGEILRYGDISGDGKFILFSSLKTWKTNMDFDHMTGKYDAELDNMSFECVETASGEDIVLSTHAYEDESGTVVRYKGELSNGIEFWFEPYDKGAGSIIYTAHFSDDTKALLIYYTDTREIEINASEDTYFGRMQSYNGRYVISDGTQLSKDDSFENEEYNDEIEVHFGTMIYGSKYECFETKSGEDIIMYLWPNEATDELGISFGESDDGPWLMLTEDEDDYLLFEAITDSGHCTLKWYKYSSEIEFEAPKGELGSMSGTYIGLPD